MRKIDDKEREKRNRAKMIQKDLQLKDNNTFTQKYIMNFIEEWESTRMAILKKAG